MPYAAALSAHPVPSHAVGEAVGQLLDGIGSEPDLVVLFAGAAHTGAMEDIAAAVVELLQPRVFVGCTASTVVGGSNEIEDAAGLSLWAAKGVLASAHRLTAEHRDGGVAITGFPANSDLVAEAGALLVLADPFSFPVEHLLEGLRAQVGSALPVIGGLASAGRGPGGNRLVIDGTVFSDGAVAVPLGGAVIETVVSQGCRPIGDPMIVTKGEGNLVHELAGQPALQRVQEILRSLTPEEVELARNGLHVGRVVDESKATFGRGDFIIRNVLGADRRAGAVAVGDEVEVGATVQLQVRDASTADEDLRHLLTGRMAAGALVFTCNGRGTHLFGIPDHDASVITEALAGAPLAGMSCAGEIGPVGNRSFLHGFTASVALFRD
jgi:small ligand-binding sensory domain FIST